MDNVWALRVAYTEAVKLVEAQNAFCAKAENGLWNLIDTPFPQDIKWESLVDVIRGRVKVCIISLQDDHGLILNRFLQLAKKPLISTQWFG